jgi:HPt (histidine-containing phosphotransfer) domain-containing protein
MSALAEILGTDDSVILNEVLTEFLAVADVSLKEVRAAVSIGEPGGIKAAAHSAKGEARSAAATRLSDLYAELELAAKDEDWVVADELVIRAAVELRHVENFIRERLAAAQ